MVVSRNRDPFCVCPQIWPYYSLGPLIFENSQMAVVPNLRSGLKAVITPSKSAMKPQNPLCATSCNPKLYKPTAAPSPHKGSTVQCAALREHLANLEELNLGIRGLQGRLVNLLR